MLRRSPHDPRDVRRSARSGSTTTTTTRRATCSATSFRRQLELAHELGLPVVVHLREAHDDGERDPARGRAAARPAASCTATTSAPSRCSAFLDAGLLRELRRPGHASRRPTRSARPRRSCRSTASSPRPTARSWRPSRSAAARTSRRYTVFTAARHRRGARRGRCRRSRPHAYANALRRARPGARRERRGRQPRPRVLCIAGSPRRHGNSEQLLDALVRGVREAGGRAGAGSSPPKPACTPCRGCNACSQTGECVLRDGMDEVYAAARRGRRDRRRDAGLLRDGARGPQDALRPLPALLGAPLRARRAARPRTSARARSWWSAGEATRSAPPAPSRRARASSRVLGVSARDRLRVRRTRRRVDMGHHPRPSSAPRRSAASSSRRCSRTD